MIIILVPGDIPCKGACLSPEVSLRINDVNCVQVLTSNSIIPVRFMINDTADRRQSVPISIKDSTFNKLNQTKMSNRKSIEVFSAKAKKMSIGNHLTNKINDDASQSVLSGNRLTLSSKSDASQPSGDSTFNKMNQTKTSKRKLIKASVQPKKTINDHRLIRSNNSDATTKNTSLRPCQCSCHLNPNCQIPKKQAIQPIKKNAETQTIDIQKPKREQKPTKEVTLIRCNQCNLSFASWFSLTRHNYRIHCEAIAFPCKYPKCKRQFRTLDNLNQHYKGFHKEKKEKTNKKQLKKNPKKNEQN